MNVTRKARRRVIQLAALALLLLPLWFEGVLWYGTYISADLAGVALTDPLTALEITLASRTVWLPLLLSAVPLVLAAALLGRVFCSYICPLNLLLELLPVRRKKALKERALPFAALGITLLLSLLLALPVFNTVSPVFALMRMLLFGAGAEMVLLGVIVGVSLAWGQKIWCRTLCPLGALYGLLGLRRRLFLRVDAARCSHCGRCAAACTMGTAPGRGNLVDAALCTNCGDCVDACRDGAVRFTLQGKP